MSDICKDLSKIECGRRIRDSVHNYIIQKSNEIEDTVFFERLKSFIVKVEGMRYEAYLDGIPDPDDRFQFIAVAKFNSLDDLTQAKLRRKCEESPRGRKPITTVGIGANIETEDFRKQYDKLLGVPGLVQRVYDGEVNLTDDQVDKIFRESIRVRLVQLRQIYGSDWDKLRANERMAIISLYFNHPSLAKDGTNFREHIRKYIEASDVQHLKAAVKEVREKSNKDKDVGQQNRRDAEAELLSSHKCPAYTKPHESPDAVKIREAHLNDTIMPINCDPLCSEQGVNAEYFVWRTRMDHKVRENHLQNEGKIFRRDNPTGFLPGETHNCRCQAEDVPDEVHVHDDEAYKQAFEFYIRKGIQNTRLMRRSNSIPSRTL